MSLPDLDDEYDIVNTAWKPTELEIKIGMEILEACKPFLKSGRTKNVLDVSYDDGVNVTMELMEAVAQKIRDRGYQVEVEATIPNGFRRFLFSLSIIRPIRKATPKLTPKPTLQSQ